MKKRFITNYILLGIAGLLIFCLSDYIQWYGDSYHYRFDFGTGLPVEDMAGVFRSQYEHYFTMNGRIWAHVLSQGFSTLWGQTAFAVCNAAVYIVFILLMARLTGLSWRKTPELLTCILSILFFTDTSYNANCQIGYIWTSTVMTAFIIMYFRYRKASHYNIWQLAGLFVLSMFAGDSNEAIAIGAGAALILDFACNYKRITVPQLVMICGFGIAGLILCLSPGTLFRASQAGTNPVWSVYRVMIYSRMLYVMIFTLSVLKLRHRIRLKDFFIENVFFFTAILALLAFNFFIGVGAWSRQLFGVEFFSCIITLRALKGSKVPGWILAVATVMVAGIYYLKFDYLTKSNEDLRTLREKISQAGDMKIYMDFHRYPVFVHPTELTNSYGMYLFAAYAIYDDMSDFGNFYHTLKDRGHVPPYYGHMAIYPQVIKEIIKTDDKNFARKCDDGLYLIVRDPQHPRSFFLERDYDILGIRIPKAPYEIEFAKNVNPNLNLTVEGLDIAYGDFDTPMVSNGKVIMK